MSNEAKRHSHFPSARRRCAASASGARRQEHLAPRRAVRRPWPKAPRGCRACSTPTTCARPSRPCARSAPRWHLQKQRRRQPGAARCAAGAPRARAAGRHLIDCGNSGTTARLLMGVLAPWDVRGGADGRRIAAPPPHAPHHRAAHEDGRALRARRQARRCPSPCAAPAGLRAIAYDAPMASAQLKTAVLLAGVFARRHDDASASPLPRATTPSSCCPSSACPPRRPTARPA